MSRVGRAAVAGRSVLASSRCERANPPRRPCLSKGGGQGLQTGKRTGQALPRDRPRQKVWVCMWVERWGFPMAAAISCPFLPFPALPAPTAYLHSFRGANPACCPGPPLRPPPTAHRLPPAAAHRPWPPPPPAAAADAMLCHAMPCHGQAVTAATAAAARRDEAPRVARPWQMVTTRRDNSARPHSHSHSHWCPPHCRPTPTPASGFVLC